MENPESAVQALHTQTQSFLDQQLKDLGWELNELEVQLNKLRAHLNEVEKKGLEATSAIRAQKHKVNELRQKVKKHHLLLAEIDPHTAPHEYQRLNQERDTLESELANALHELEQRREAYDQTLAEEDNLIHREWELEQELNQKRARYLRLLDQVSQLAQAIERRVREMRAKHF
ncbi:MAG: hypothetical protein N3A55_08410 [Methylohalobius sp.]|nr:hypothetical protein [Methylohalobius sp.]